LFLNKYSRGKPLHLFIGIILVFFSISYISTSSSAQELEPRSLTNLPVGMNFVIAGYSYAQGNILLDPSVPIEDLDAKLHAVIGGYLRSVNFFGLSGKVDVVLPWASGDFTGIYTGVDTARSLSGMGDARIRLGINFLGAPALKLKTFGDYKPVTISGISLQIIAPTGQYNPEKLINIGSNRWVFRPQWGFAMYMKKWRIETYISARFFTANNNFLDGNELKQNPFGAIKIHAIRSFLRNWWLALDAGYGFGGKTYLNGEESDTRISTIRLGITFAVPVGQHHTFRLTGISGIRLERGSDFDAIALTYQYRWIK
jgi:hypothetical protein